MTFSLPTDLTLTFLGHSTIHLVTPSGKRLLIDPWVRNNPRCPADKKNIGALDRVLITHGHFDHIADAVEILKDTQAEAVCVFETAVWLGSKKVEKVAPMNKGGTLRVDGLGITMVHADHSCGIQDGDQIVYGGEASGYVIEFEDGYRIYHAGDTAVFGDMRLIGEIYHPDLALLPIGDRFVMSPLEAAHATRLLGVPHVVPIHHGTFPMLTGTPDAFRAALDDLNVQAEVHTLEPGEELR